MFNIGDRVIATTDFDNNPNIVGIEGTIRCYGTSSGRCGVEFDIDVGGHDLCIGTVKYGHGWYCPESILQPILSKRNLIAQDLLKILENNDEEI